MYNIKDDIQFLNELCTGSGIALSFTCSSYFAINCLILAVYIKHGSCFLNVDLDTNIILEMCIAFNDHNIMFHYLQSFRQWQTLTYH